MESDLPLPPEPDPAPAPEPPACPACGTPIRESANFCPGCGEPLREGLPRAPRRLTARQILSDVRRSPTPVRRTLAFYLLWNLTGLVASLAASAKALAVHIIMAMDVVTTSVTGIWALTYRREVFKLYAFPKGGAAWLVLPVLAAWPIAAAISLSLGWLSDLVGVDVKITSLFLDQGYGWGWIILLICVQPAVVEELAFRGIIQTTLRDAMRPVDAIVVSAVAFSIMHWNGVVLVPFFLLGCYLGWLRLRTESLWPTMIAHFLHNLLVVLDEWVNILPG